VARAKFITDDAFDLMLEKAADKTKDVAEAALKEGAKIIANRMKANLQGILSEEATGQLVAAFGITPVKENREGNWNVHLGFDGYQMPWNIPFQLIARSFESGAVMGGRYTGKTSKGRKETKKKKFGPEDYWRMPTPFAKPAVQATKQQALEAMKRAAEQELRKITEGGK
jgi:hypothetical protein